MMSTRALVRAFRAPSARLSARTLVTKPVFQSTWKSSSLINQQPRAFSTTIRAFEKQGNVDQELAMKLESELQLEQGMTEHDSNGYPPSVQEFLKDSPFKVNDKPGQEDVELVRKFGDETIRVIFSISDLNSMDSAAAEDDAMFDDDVDGHEPSSASTQSGGAQSMGAKDQDRVPTEEADESDDFMDEVEPFPARIDITIEKPNQGALAIDAIAQDGMIVIENVSFHKNAALAMAANAEADWEREGMYAGPPFGNLDEDLQILLERYLEERGVNNKLALFVPDYIDFKEQNEYLGWLQNVKGFVEA